MPRLSTAACTSARDTVHSGATGSNQSYSNGEGSLVGQSPARCPWMTTLSPNRDIDIVQKMVVL